MGNGASFGQGGNPASGKRDVREHTDSRQLNWPELAEAPNTNRTSQIEPARRSDDEKPYSDAQLRGQKSEDDARRGAYSNAYKMESNTSQLRSSSPTEDNTRRDAHSCHQLWGQKSVASSTEDLFDTYSDAQSRIDTTRDDDCADNDDYNGTQQRDQQSPRTRRKLPSPQPVNESSSSDEEYEKVGEVCAEDNGLQEERRQKSEERRKKSSLDATLSESVLPKSTNTRSGASARPTGRVADHYAEDKKSTYTYDDASARPISGRAAARHAEKRNYQAAEVNLHAR